MTDDSRSLLLFRVPYTDTYEATTYYIQHPYYIPYPSSPPYTAVDTYVDYSYCVLNSEY
jgi:hypothetical protein